jgi:formiminotetrahydrofolate cyclodeaminase
VSANEDILGLSVRDFTAATAAKTPTPGGGSIAGVVGSLAAALGEMSLNFTRGKKAFAAQEETLAAVAGRLARAREMFQQLVTDDMAAYALYQEVSRSEDGPEKPAAFQTALAAAINVPREAAKLSLAMLADLKLLADGRCSRWLVSDLLAAATLAVATVRLSEYNVRVNVPQVADQDAARQVRQSAGRDVARAVALRDEIEELLREALP